eukprot:6198377-Pleurochrysis_carterae.AAC.1
MSNIACAADRVRLLELAKQRVAEARRLRLSGTHTGLAEQQIQSRGSNRPVTSSRKRPLTVSGKQPAIAQFVHTCAR